MQPSTAEPTDDRSSAILRLGRNRRLAHRTLFAHRHPQTTPAFHYEIIDLWASSAPQVLIMAFRGAAKSTLAEEAIALMACYREYHNGLILGETYARAVERLTAIKHEFETNAFIEELFGNMVGPTWTEGKIVLANGVIIQAFGRGQSLRGSKHLDHRPDMAFGDDIEDEESTASDDAIKKTMRWLMSVVKPALAPGARIRINGTPLHPKAMVMQLAAEPDWETRVYPWEYKDAETGARSPTWGSRFPLTFIDVERKRYERLGMLHEYNQEYMCKAEDAGSKAFQEGMLKVEPVVRTWQPTYAMYDPARTANKNSAQTGVAVWSWVANRLIVWDAYGRYWKPDEIISDVFRVDEEYRPIVVGIEEDGLNEFVMQPLRQEQLRRQYAVPIRAMKAPKGKFDFITSLQPFFKAGEVVFAKELPELKSQLLGFPTGLIDVPNALAYAMRLRPGQPVYAEFGTQHIAQEVVLLARRPVFLAVNGTQMYTTAVLLQMVDGGLTVIWDAVREGDPGASLHGIVQEASVLIEQKPRLCAGPDHFDQYDTIGLRAAARKIPAEVQRGGMAHVGREEVRALLRRMSHGAPAFTVSQQARWTLNALSGGYAKEVTKAGILTEFPVPGPYATLMEGVENFAALLKSGSVRDDLPVNYARTPDGRRYISSRANG